MNYHSTGWKEENMHKKRYVCIYAVVIIQLLMGSIYSVNADDWPMQGHDSAHTSYSSSLGPATNHTLFIETVATSYGGICVADGRVFVSTEYNHIKVFDTVTGELLSDFSGFTGNIQTTPAVDSEQNTVYFTTTSGILYCLDATTGIQHWTYTAGAGIYCSPTLANDRIYIGSHNKKLICIKLNGEEDWSYTTNSSVMCTPAVSNEKVFFGSNDDNFYCLNAKDGTLEWMIQQPPEVSADIRAHPAIANGRVFFVSADNDLLHCYTFDGEFLWNFTLGTDFTSPGPAVYNNKVYIGSSDYLSDGKFYCIDAETGVEQWNFALPFYSTQDYIRSTAALADGKVYIGFGAKKVYCLNANTGDIIWDYTTEHSISADIALADGIVYVPSTKRLHAFGPMENSPPVVPETPDGAKQGEIDISYSFSTSTTDPDGDQLYYMFDWDDSGFTNTWIGPYNSGQTITANHQFTEKGIYTIKVKAKDQNGAISDWSSLYSITITQEIPTLGALNIIAESSVKEGSPFAVLVTDSAGHIVSNVVVTFNNEIQQSDENGEVTLIAPQVENTDYYFISAKKKEYQSAQKGITILDTDAQEENKQWIWGTVYDESYKPLENVEVCARRIAPGKLATTFCKLTSTDGVFVHTITPGTFMVTASKSGYEPSSKSIQFNEGDKIGQVDFVLSQQILDYSTDVTEQLLRGKITDEIKNDRVGVKIEVEENEVILYNTEIEIELNDVSDNDLVDFHIKGEDIPVQVIVVHITDSSKDLSVYIDGEPITETYNLDTFFSPENENLEYVEVFTNNGERWVLINLHFSEHTVLISEITEAIAGITLIALYVGFCVLIGLMLVSPAFISALFQTYSKKKK